MYILRTTSKKMLADTLTPVNIYLKLRDVFAGSLLLESSDYHGHENSLSFICCDPIATFEITGRQVSMAFPDGEVREEAVVEKGDAVKYLDQFRQSFSVADPDTRYIHCGLFGYMAYDSVRYFEDVDIAQQKIPMPDVLYKVYRYVIVVDHFSNELTLFQNSWEGNAESGIGLERMEQIIFSNRFSTYRFNNKGKEQSNFTDEEFLRIVEKGKEHCFRGDVFQIVLSRRFTSGFSGDEFNVYRALRSINPSPYLFYFDYGNFKLFGSSPEAQLQVQKGRAYIYPIAGTFRRSGNDQEDAEIASRLSADEKENAEHVMLVDLGRNDLGRVCEFGSVRVPQYMALERYSHVMHLVSRVEGTLAADRDHLDALVACFPAGTVSGAPKIRAMQILAALEPTRREIYAGAVGYIDFAGNLDFCIAIRTITMRRGRARVQAGAGIVADSNPAAEYEETRDKARALLQALTMAEAGL